MLTGVGDEGAAIVSVGSGGDGGAGIVSAVGSGGDGSGSGGSDVEGDSETFSTISTSVVVSSTESMDGTSSFWS